MLNAIAERIARSDRTPPQIGQFYNHPEDGVIYITGGQYMSNGRLSNHWHWTIVETGEKSYGYGSNWPIADGWTATTVFKYEENK